VKIAIGTAQFGLNYGIANQRGQVSHDEAKAILDCASNSGIDTLDTAIAYGESEKLLGEIGVEKWRVITKLPPMPNNVLDAGEWVRESALGSLSRLKVSRLGGVLLHRSEELLGSRGQELYLALVSLRNQGKVEKIGVSIYNPEELDALWSIYKFDIVQAPFNVIDRRLSTSGWLARLHDSGVEVHTRSAFLQGLLLMSQKERPVAFDRWRTIWDFWQEWTTANSVTPLQACLGFVLSRDEISRVVVGVDGLSQLKEILSNSKVSVTEPPAILASNDENLINPSRWATS